jgi:hypothetical protein
MSGGGGERISGTRPSSYSHIGALPGGKMVGRGEAWRMGVQSSVVASANGAQ